MRVYLEACVEYIELHLARQMALQREGRVAGSQALTLDGISGAIGFSKYYLNSMFSTYTGMSLMQYARKRRLYHGLKAYSEGARLGSVADALGYGSERAFSRAVVNAMGRSPGYFKAKSVPGAKRLEIYDLSLELPEDMLDKPVPITQMGIQQNLIERGVKAMKDYLSDVSYVVLPAMTVLSGVAYGSEPEDAIIGLMHRMAAAYGIKAQRSFGFDSPVEGDRDAVAYRGYEYWLVVAEAELGKLPGLASGKIEFEGSAIVRKDIPGYRYATLTIKDPMSAPFERIPGGWRALTAWLETRDFKEMTQGPHCHANCLEEVVTVPATSFVPASAAATGSVADSSDEVTVMRLYIPVE